MKNSSFSYDSTNPDDFAVDFASGLTFPLSAAPKLESW